jgi:hypothetical protein
MNIFRNQHNESENEDDWGWFITLDLDANTSKISNTPTPTPICDYDTNKKTDSTRKNNCDFYKNLLIYGLFYTCIYVDHIYKCINSFSCYKHKTCN